MIDGLGRSVVVLREKTPEGFLQHHFGVQSRLQLMETERHIYSKVLLISPYKIIANNTQGKIVIRQKSVTNENKYPYAYAYLEPFSRMPFPSLVSGFEPAYEIKYTNSKN